MGWSRWHVAWVSVSLWSCSSATGGQPASRVTDARDGGKSASSLVSGQDATRADGKLLFSKPFGDEEN